MNALGGQAGEALLIGANLSQNGSPMSSPFSEEALPLLGR